MIRDKDKRKTYFSVKKVLITYIVRIHILTCVYICIYTHSFYLPPSLIS